MRAAARAHVHGMCGHSVRSVSPRRVRRRVGTNTRDVARCAGPRDSCRPERHLHRCVRPAAPRWRGRHGGRGQAQGGRAAAHPGAVDAWSTYSHSTRACRRAIEAASTRPGTICRCATSSSRSTGSSTSTRLRKTSSTAWPRHPPGLPCPRPPSPTLASPRPAYSLTSTGARGARTRGL